MIRHAFRVLTVRKFNHFILIQVDTGWFIIFRIKGAHVGLTTLAVLLAVVEGESWQIKVSPAEFSYFGFQ